MAVRECLSVCDLEEVLLKYALKIVVHESKARHFGKALAICIAGCSGH